MRKIPIWHILLWAFLVVLAVVSGILGVVLSLPAWLTIILVVGFAAGAAVWVTVDLLSAGKKKKKPSVAFTGNSALYERMLKDAQSAVARYLGTATGKNLGRRSLLYERPWFLLCGSDDSKKTELLQGSGLHVPVRYPSEQDGLMLEGSRHVTWHFANEAVWIDVPSEFMSETGRDQWQALIAALSKVRPDRPIEGIAVVTNGNQILSSDNSALRDTARMFRSRIDELIAMWGIEFPVYLVFNQSDKLPGFLQFFDQKPDFYKSQILGATLPMEKQNMMPRVAFAEEYTLLASRLEALRLDMLHNQKDPVRKRLICRFVIQFEGMQEKLGAMVTELFRPSSYVGKPIFRGFYFTGYKESSEENQKQSSEVQSVGNTIVNHPLNPHRASGDTTSSGSIKSRKQAFSLFALPLFRSIMVRDRSLVKVTRKRSQKEMVRFAILSAILALITTGAGVFLITGLRESQGVYRLVKETVTEINQSAGSIQEEYEQLDKLRNTIEILEFHSPGVAGKLTGFYRKEKLLEQLRHEYTDRARRVVIGPALKYLEYQIRRRSSLFGELVGDEYDMLYRDLKTYLSVSEAISARPEDIDTVFLRGTLSNAVTQTLLSVLKASRLPESIEEILQSNMGLVLFYLKNQRLPLVQTNQRIVSEARRRLQRLPNARSLYETVINRLIPESPAITLDEMLQRSSEGLLKGEQSISSLFTQQGYEMVVHDALSKASKNPYNIDWVVGVNKEDIPSVSPDSRKLREDMLVAYLDDFRQRWVEFIGAVSFEPFGELERSSRMLRQLVGGQSELEMFLSTVATYVFLNPASEGEKLGDKALETAGKLKGTKKMAKKAERARGASSSFLPANQSTPFDRVNRYFEPLRNFARSSGGGFGGYQGYRDKMLTLSEALEKVASRGEEDLPSVLTGKEDDPLQDAWRFVEGELTLMPEGMSEPMGKVLLEPLKNTGRSASMVLSRVLNKRWHDEVVRVYSDRLAGRFPFASNSDETAFSEAMEFFRPSTGTIWGFHERVLAPYLVKTRSGWMVRSMGSINLEFNPEMAKTLSSAERIRNMFFKSDGTLRGFIVTITSSPTNSVDAAFVLNGQEFSLPKKGGTIQISWPSETTPAGAKLRLAVSSDFSQEIAQKGAWGFMKLIEAGTVSQINETAFNVQWEVDVQNMYRLRYSCRMSISGSDHPFADQVFRTFDCPTDLIVAAQGTGAK